MQIQYDRPLFSASELVDRVNSWRVTRVQGRQHLLQSGDEGLTLELSLVTAKQHMLFEPRYVPTLSPFTQLTQFQRITTQRKMALRRWNLDQDNKYGVTLIV